MGKALTMDSYIRNMHYSSFVKLATLLDPENYWERLAVEIPMKLEMLGHPDAEPRYSHQHMANFALQGNKPGSSPTRRVLQDWGTKNATIRHLITALVKAGLYAAADYLHNDLLQLGPAPRQGGDDGSTSSEQSGPSQNDRENCESSLSKLDENLVPSGKDSCQESPEKPGKGEKDLATLVARPCDKSEHGEDSNTGSIGSSESGWMSVWSGDMSAANEAGLPSLSRLERELSVPDDGNEDAWIGLQSIEVQAISYSMLGTITDNFNDKPLEEGGSVIGSGGFGKVYLGKFHNGFKIAVKSLRVDDQLKAEDLTKQFETEVKMLSQYRHDNILHLLGYSTDGPSPCLVYQYLPNGSLEDRLACLHGTPPLSANMRLKIIQGTASGIAYLNGEKYVHRDIKSANILLDSEFTAKVGDFATVRRAPSGTGKTTAISTTVVIGTPAYLAREAYSFDISTKLDAYSFGVVLLEVITGLPAQDPDREEPVLQSHIRENVDEPSDIINFVDPRAGEWAAETVEKLYDIACRCLEDSKKRRPNVSDVKPEIDALVN